MEKKQRCIWLLPSKLASGSCSIVYNTDDDSVLLYVDGITIKSTAKCREIHLSLGKSTVDNVGIQGLLFYFVYNIY